jgi:acetyltransferase-like isoleucine patch superfamily enzyme
MRLRAFVLFLKALRAYDCARLRLRMLLQPGLDIHPDASGNFASAHFALEPGATLRIGPGAVTERRPGALRFDLRAGATVEVGARAWLRTDGGEVHISAYEGASIEIGPDAFVNGATLSAKRRVRLGRHTFVGLGSRVFDSDQHDFDAERPEQAAPVEIGDHVWVASDATVLRGVAIGDHSIIGTRSLVTRDVAAHTLAYGSPATARGSVGDRSGTR